MMRTPPHAIRLLSGRRLGLATVAAIVVAAFAPTSALAGLDNLTTNLTDVDATVENVTSTVSDLTAPVAKTPQTQPPAAQAPAAQTTPVQQAAPSVAPTVSENVAPLANPVANVTAPLANTTNEIAKTTAPVVSSVQSAAAPVTAPVDRAAAPLVQSVQQTAQPVVDTVQRATTPVVQTVAHATAPVLTTVAQTTAPVLATVDQVAAPAVTVVSPLVQQTAQTATEAIAPILDETGQVLDPVVRTTEQVVAPHANRVVQDGSPSRGPVQEATTPTSEPGSVGGPTQQSGVVEPARVIPSASTTPAQDSPLPRHERRAATRLPNPAPLFDFGDTFVAQGVTEDTSSSSPQAKASRTPAPVPFTPGRPFGFSLTAAAGGASFFVPLFAVVAAISLLAAQGVGRRLRPTLAPPQLPILALSLERPG